MDGSRSTLDEQVFRSSLAAQLLIDPENGRIVSANDAAGALCGISRQALVSRPVSSLSPDEPTDLARGLREAASGRGCLLSLERRLASGEVRRLGMHCAPVTYHGRPHVWALLHDIGDTSPPKGDGQDKFRAILEHMEEAYFELDMSGHLTFFNDALCRILGHTRAELVGMKLRDQQADADDPLLTEKLDEVRGTGTASPHFDCWLRAKNGERRLVTTTLSLIRNAFGLPAGFRGIGRDSTEGKRAEEALRESERRFRDLFDNAPVGLHEIDAEGLYYRVNRTELAMLGYEEQEVIGRPAWQFIVETISEGTFRGKISGQLQVPRQPYERTYRRKDGSLLPVLVEDRLLHDAGGKPRGIRRALSDLTARKRAEDALRDSEERYRQLVELSPDAIVVHSEGRFVFVNSAAARLFGAKETQELLGRTAMDFVHPDSQELMRERERRLAEKHAPVPLLEQKLVRLDGSPVDVELAAMPLTYHDHPAVQVVIRDITDRKHAEEKIRELAYHDTLTRLPNRLLFNDRLAMALAQAQRHQHKVGVLFIDLDRFKVINDSLGHGFGDRLLQAVALRIQGFIREGDTLARLGGDEFTLLLPGLEHADDATKVAKKVLESIRLPFELEGRELFITTSLGVSVYPEDGADVEELVKNSDIAMYRAKEQGRDNYQLYAPAMNTRALERLHMENSLRKALVQNELVVYYQPLVDLRTGRIEAVEALVRWLHPELGVVGPSEFIPIAEATGLIVPIGPWVLRTACTQVRSWQLRGYPALNLCVNLSARQFKDPQLGAQIRAALQETGLAASSLELEITESSAMENAEITTTILDEIKALGVRISIDDFGIGYSSLSYLKRLPINTLKIDQSFVRDITTDPDDAAIARAVIAMAHSLKLKVVAEGVETAEQLAFLVTHRCDKIQGFYFSRPLPGAECEAVLDRSLHVQRPIQSVVPQAGHDF